ncbi:DgyrCDS11808 [Dimorphilus gyrociliatus]|uniref:DgyrCDS11808 n=1 Tax=Dimorphilus gyrociliatus TaxID=2664684 RepID=A0A7I8W5M0_9ANNE|nr:DgyrCDS11808 [Dimorphilus gyrociliatus]
MEDVSFESVGTGALAMPLAFSAAGWLISLILIVILGLMSYVTVTFVVESMACANAIIKNREEESNSKIECTDERSPLLQDGSINESENSDKLYDITRRVEMGQMARLFFNKLGLNLFYICLAIYLYGDLAIYAVAVPKSLRDVICTYEPGNMTNSFLSNSSQNESCRNPDDYDLCWENVKTVNRVNAYRICLTIFTILLGPFVFFNVQKTKYLQILTTGLRWFSAILPPICVAYGTDNVEFLVGITGSYAGAGIQYVIPAALVIYARRRTCYKFGTVLTNKYKSPFGSRYWVYLVFAWAVLCIVFVTVNHIITRS